MDWFYLALIYPLLWAIVNLIDDNLVQNIYRTPHFGAIMSGLFGSLPAAALAFVPNSTLPNSTAFLALGSGILLVVFYFYYFRSLGHEAPSVIVSLMNLISIFIPLLALAFLGEKLSLPQYVGLLIILIGSLGISAIDVKNFHFSKALGLMAFASLLYAASAIMLKQAYMQADFFPVYGHFCMGMGIGAFAFLIFTKDGRTFFEDMRQNEARIIGFLVIAEIINVAAELVQNIAISRGPVSIIKVVEGIQPMYIIVIAIVLYPFFPKQFREAAYGKIPTKVMFMAVMIGGLYLVNISGAG